MNIDIVIPISVNDYNVAKTTIPYVLSFLEPKRIVVVGNSKISEFIKQDFADNSKVSFVDEDKMIEGLSFKYLRNVMTARNAEKRTGWYYQQLLKLGYALTTEDDYYITWDADMIPLKKISFFDSENHPLFSSSNEYNHRYFNTLKNLLNLDKCIKDSFISEHMVFNTETVRTMLGEIESDSGKKWYDRIIECVSDDHLTGSGFSEFETYGTYCVTRYPDKYRFRKLHALRGGKTIFGVIPDVEVLKWLSKCYDTISFEKFDSCRIYSKPYTSAFFRKVVSPYIYVKVCINYVKLFRKTDKTK